MKYYIVKYVKELPLGFGGTAQGPVIKLLSKHKADVGLLEHEKVHVRQWYVGLIFGLAVSTMLMLLVSLSFWPLYGMAPYLHPLTYRLIRVYRRWCEVRAYRKQIQVGGYSSIDFAVIALVEKYDLGMSVDQARTLLLD